ncbi:MAG: tetratricopeptide repeat protein, partial [Gemmatimonadota bacterium]|nr:tetratricopeptide repeat protein [Gemmatimonadota bacterium]
MDPLRFALVNAAILDPEKVWATSSAFATIDQRVIGLDAVATALKEAEQSLHEQISELFSTVDSVLRACYAGQDADAAQQLIALGERYEERGQLARARQFYEHALRLSLPLADRAAQVLALRRIGRILLTYGDLAEAHLYYSRCVQVARDTEAFEIEINARIGAGNALLRQGRLSNGEAAYREALARIAEAGLQETLALQQAQLYNNLAVAALRQNQLDQAEEWLGKAVALWEVVSSPVDYAIYHIHLAELRARQGHPSEGRAIYERGLSLTAPPVIRAILAIELAELCMAAGLVQDAIHWAREAENYAIAAHSVDYLSHVYRGLGNIARDTGHEDGVAFYEKALDLARKRSLPFAEGAVLLEYAQLRAQSDGIEEARAYLEQARDVFLELGATYDAGRAE